MKTAFIYGLRCPLTGQIRYVGKCENPKIRFPAHLRSEESCHRGNWLRLLKAKGLQPVFEVLAKVPDDSWEFWERSYIRLYRCLGFDLVNGTEGGDGGRQTPDVCAKISASKTGEKNPMFGKKHSAETRTKQSESHKGKERSSGYRENISAAKRGDKNGMFEKIHSTETRIKMSLSQKARREAEAIWK